MKLSLIKAKANGRRDTQIIIDTLEDMWNKNKIATMSFQSGQMSILFEKYCWYTIYRWYVQLNKARMFLYCFMVEDEFGDRRILATNA